MEASKKVQSSLKIEASTYVLSFTTSLAAQTQKRRFFICEGGRFFHRGKERSDNIFPLRCPERDEPTKSQAIFCNLGDRGAVGAKPGSCSRGKVRRSSTETNFSEGKKGLITNKLPRYTPRAEEEEEEAQRSCCSQTSFAP